MRKIEIIMGLMLSSIVLFGQCPTDQDCVDYTIEINLADVPSCTSGDEFYSQGDLDNNSDCEDSNGDNCFRWILYRPEGSDIVSVTADLGKGSNCNGEVNTIYSYSDGCIDHGSSGSQNVVTFEFGTSDTLTIWICDQSSAKVSLCDLCVNHSTLPIDLVYFRASNRFRNEVSLDWATSQEINNDFFIIEKSRNLQSWDIICEIDASFNPSQNNAYSYIHNQEESGDMYYRLSQVDLDGSITTFYKNTVSCRVYNKADVKMAMAYGVWYDWVGRHISRQERGLYLVRYKDMVYKIYR
jgi:hypothetical protein